MKIDIVIPTANKGGVENVINETIKFLHRNGHQIRMMQIVGTKEWCVDFIEHHIVSDVGKVFQIDEISGYYAEFVTQNGVPDMVLATVWPIMCEALFRAREQYRLQNPEKEADFKIVSWIHHGSVAYLEAANWGGYRQLAFADGHLAINHYLYQEIPENIPGALTYRIYNPVDFDRVVCDHSKRNREIEDNKLQAIFVGRIAPEKGLEVILHALSRVKEQCVLHIVGSTPGEYEDSIRKLIDELGLHTNIIWQGWTNNPWADAENMDVCIMSSQVEGFPLVAIEALANGLPLLATPAEGIEELIEDGVNGYLYPFGDDVTLSKLLWALANHKLPKMQSEACKKSVENHQMEKALTQFEKVLREMLNNQMDTKRVGELM